MQTKLTLSVDKDFIEQAKAYAKKRGISLSKMFQDLLSKKIKAEQVQDVDLPEDLKEIYASIEIPEDFDYKQDLSKSLAKKYSKSS